MIGRNSETWSYDKDEDRANDKKTHDNKNHDSKHSTDKRIAEAEEQENEST